MTLVQAKEKLLESVRSLNEEKISNVELLRHAAWVHGFLDAMRCEYPMETVQSLGKAYDKAFEEIIKNDQILR